MVRMLLAVALVGCGHGAPSPPVTLGAVPTSGSNAGAHATAAASSPLDEVAAWATGHACALDRENLSGRGDPASCGPFPCDFGECVVTRCEEGGSCYPGFCSQGYCVTPAKASGTRACPAGASAAYDRPEAVAGCACFPQSAGRRRDQPACGPFPCGADGCYVQPCRGDGDCAYGLCSAHASGPHGYCVTDDPI